MDVTFKKIVKSRTALPPGNADVLVGSLGFKTNEDDGVPKGLRLDYIILPFLKNIGCCEMRPDDSGVVKSGWNQKEILVFHLAHRIQIDRAFSPDSWGNTYMGRWPMLV